eukprot:gene16012-biopygen14302
MVPCLWYTAYGTLLMVPCLWWALKHQNCTVAQALGPPRGPTPARVNFMGATRMGAMRMGAMRMGAMRMGATRMAYTNSIPSHKVRVFYRQTSLWIKNITFLIHWESVRRAW